MTIKILIIIFLFFTTTTKVIRMVKQPSNLKHLIVLLFY